MVQIVLALVTIVILAIITFLLFSARRNESAASMFGIKPDLKVLGEEVSRKLAEMVRLDDFEAKSDMMFKSIVENKKRISEALDECIYGVQKSKSVVLSQIKHILEGELPNIEDIIEYVDFTDLQSLTPSQQWEVLIYKINSSHRNNPIQYLNDKYNIFGDKIIKNEINGEFQTRRLFDNTDLANIITTEITEPLKYSEMLDIISLLIYQQRYGLGIIDTLRAIDVDGFNFGTSGSIRYRIDNNYTIPYRTENSIWVQKNAKWCHFSFLDFEVEGEMKRVINQLVSWGTSAPMTENKPYKVNDAYDGARITAIRPPACECWACCVRKFSSGLYVKEKLLNKPMIHNWELPSGLIYYLMRGEQTTAFTGQQNTGKTSMMKAAMADVAMVNIRILEMSFELAIRELYPWKNVITVKPTDYVTSSQIQDLLKKTDGYLSMVGEVAEDIVAARMIQFCLIASAFTIFSHHARDDYSLINGLANSLVACGEYENHDVAMSTVLDAIKNNVHLDFIKDQRVIAYISEIIKLDEISPYPTLRELWDKIKKELPAGTSDEAIATCVSTEMNREYYTRRTDRVRFESRKIIVFDPDDMTYKANEGYSPEALTSMLSKLQGKDRSDFIQFYKKNWAHVFDPNVPHPLYKKAAGAEEFSYDSDNY